MKDDKTDDEETVRLTISMPKSLLDEFDAKCLSSRPKKPRSRRIQELIFGDLEAAVVANSDKK
jgi:metal-responsive CopG/Arc/MetJ family transcriptional regulator